MSNGWQSSTCYRLWRDRPWVTSNPIRKSYYPYGAIYLWAFSSSSVVSAMWLCWWTKMGQSRGATWYRFLILLFLSVRPYNLTMMSEGEWRSGAILVRGCWRARNSWDHSAVFIRGSSSILLEGWLRSCVRIGLHDERSDSCQWACNHNFCIDIVTISKQCIILVAEKSLGSPFNLGCSFTMSCAR